MCRPAPFRKTDRRPALRWPPPLPPTLAQVPARRDLAMTGEITLRGRVLPIGGLKEKILAAKRAKLTTVILPKRNKKDLDEIPKHILKGIQLVFADTMDDVMRVALRRRPPLKKKAGRPQPRRNRQKPAPRIEKSRRAERTAHARSADHAPQASHRPHSMASSVRSKASLQRSVNSTSSARSRQRYRTTSPSVFPRHRRRRRSDRLRPHTGTC